MSQSARSERLEAASGELSFELFFEGERRRLFRALYVLTGSVQESEEIAQDAFLKVWERWARVGAMDDPVGYLYRTALNLFRSRFRRIVRATRTTFSSERSTDPYAAADAHDAVVRALRTMSPRQRDAVVLVDLLDRTNEEAASLMRVTTSTIRSLVSEAHKSMRKHMEADDE